MNYIGEFPEDFTTVSILFTTHAASGAAVAPSTGFEAADVAIFKNGSATEKTTTNGLTMISPFNGTTGLHCLVIDTSNDTGDSGFWVAGAQYTVVLVPDETVDSLAVVKVIGTFGLALAPIFARVGAPAGVSISADIAGVQADTDNIQTRIPAALVSGRMDSSIGAVASGVIAAASFASGALDAVWSTATRLLTAGTNIVLAKGTGVTGFNDLSAAQVNAEADTALADAGLTTTVTGRIDAAISTRLASAGYTAPDNASITAIKAKTDNLPSDPADQSLIIAATNSILSDTSAIKVTTDKLDDTVEDDGGTFRFTANALEQAPSGGGSGPTASEIADEVQTRTIAAVTVVNGLAANSVTAAALAADAGTEIGTAVWAATTRRLSDGTNIVLAKGTGVTGFNDLSAAQVNAEADTALVDAGVTTARMAHLDADVSSRLASGSYTTPPTVVQIRQEMDSNSVDLDAIFLALGTVNTNVVALPSAAANAAAILAAAFEDAETVQDFLRLSRAVLYGVATGQEGSSPTFKSADGTSDRVVVTGADDDGNRPAITLDAS